MANFRFVPAADADAQIKKLAAAYVEEIGEEIADDAASIVRVDTGRLQNNISSEMVDADEPTARISARTEYASIIEDRYPYLRPALYRRR